MASIFSLLDPIWALLGRHKWVTLGVLTLLLLVSFPLHMSWLTLLAGMGVGTAIMMDAEADMPPRVAIEPPA